MTRGGDKRGDKRSLLSKVLRLVHRPAHPPGTGVQQGQLRERIERRRHNDAMRQREFDYLRRLRRRQSSAEASSAQGASGVDESSMPASFQNSQPPQLDERASTLRKIDEIEAQMTRQWLRAAAQQATPPLPGTQAASLPADLLFDAMSSQLGEPSGSSALSRSFCQAGSNAHDPYLEEAAIRFANGDDAGAEESLNQALSSERGNSDDEAEPLWLTLLDLYRATGQQHRFERAAIGFAERFGRLAPPWFSLPALQDATGDGWHWACPPTLDAPALQALDAALAQAPQPWRLDWSALADIAPGAADPLARLFQRWAGQPAALCLTGADVLERLLARHTPQGHVEVTMVWWRLRLAYLRLLNQAEPFDLVALAYCVTYEVSPPPWMPAQCRVEITKAAPPEAEAGQAQAPAAAPGGDAGPDSLSGEAPHSVYLAGAVSVELAGCVTGDMADALAQWAAALAGGDAIDVHCAKLLRVDLTAAGAILGWVAAAQANGCRVRFMQLNRLAAVFFNVIGISEHARVLTRR